MFIFVLCAAIINGQNNLPKVYTINAQKVFELRSSFLKGDLKNNPAVKKFIHNADSFLDMKPQSVIEKEQIPPSGDKHDYLSMAAYWWPDPNKADGLPYIRKDGERNPEVLKISDDLYLGNMIRAVETLSLAFYVTDKSKYSSKAAQVLRVWFLDEKSKMNPNANFAQYITGVNEGRGAGIMDMHGFCKLIDALGLLENSKDWSNNDDLNIKNWFREFLNWLRKSKYGISESNTKNNHGTWYDVQVVSISSFLGETDFAKKYLNDALINRISTQIKSDGSQPFELIRTKSWHYSLFNLEALEHLALLGEYLGIDLWNYTNKEGGSIRKALDYILPAALDSKVWKHQQIAEINNTGIYPLLVQAKRKFDKQIYSNWIEKIFDKKMNSDIKNLL
jgi:hypothetical protein